MALSSEDNLAGLGFMAGTAGALAGSGKLKKGATKAASKAKAKVANNSVEVNPTAEITH